MLPSTMRFARLITAAALSIAPVLSVHAASFSDVPPTHPAATAIDYLKEKGVLKGYEDGTFRPDAPVNRAEALKIIVAPRTTAEALAAKTTSAFTDVPQGSWFLPYVEVAHATLKVIDGPTERPSFHPEQTVNKAEFTKMLLAAYQIDARVSLGEITDGLAIDVASPSDWFYPTMRYSVASSMTMVDEAGRLNPSQQLTRAQVALLLYRLDMFRQGLRTQTLVTESETEIENVLALLERADTTNAGYAATRAMVAARGALISAPNDVIVKGAVKMSEGFHQLVRAYNAGQKQQLDQVLTLSGQAWDSSTKAMAFNAGLTATAGRLQTIARGLADEARALQAGGSQP